MTLKDQINQDFITAFKNKDMETKDFLGVIKGEIQSNEGRGIESTDENVLKILKKTEKSLNENIKNGVDGAEQEMKILKPYIPELMSEEKIKEIIVDLVADGNNNIGSIMKEFNINHKGKADNKIVKDVALQVLN